MKIEIHHHYQMDKETKNLFRALFSKLNNLERTFDKRMSELTEKVSAIQETVNSNFTSLSDTITEGFSTLQTKIGEEIEQVRSLLENNNDVTGALARLGHLQDSLNISFQVSREAITAGFQAARASISSIVPEETPANESSETSDSTEAASGS